MTQESVGLYVAQAELRTLIDLDPRTKVIVSVAAFVAAIAVNGVPAKALIVAALLALWAALGLGVKRLLLVFVPILFLFVSTFILRVVIEAHQYPDATTISGIPFSALGLATATGLCLQIAALVISLSMVVLSTKPVIFSEAIEILLAPAQRIGVPVHEAALMFSIALRFLPILSEEFLRLASAQAARGPGLFRGGIFARTKAILPLIIPLFIVTIIRARELSEAMESRGYRGAEGRTRIREYHLGAVDFGILGGTAALLAASIVLAFVAG